MESEKHREFLDDYKRYVREVLLPTNQEIQKLFKEWKDPTSWAHHARTTRLPVPSPVQRTVSRIKRPESVVDKILRKPSLFPEGLSINSVKTMGDAVAGRVVVYFLTHLPLIDKELRYSETLEISAVDPPVAYLTQDLLERMGLNHIRRMTKESGYASIHYIVRFRSSVVPSKERPWFELQVRTLAEDVWGEIEHCLGYKPNKRTSFAVRKQFQIISSQLMAIDEHFNLLYEELTRFQEEAIFRDADPLNAENLPAVLSELGITCAQREIDGLLKLLISRGVQTVGQLREGGDSRTLDVISKAYKNLEGRLPTHFELIAAIAAAQGMQEESEITEAIKAQIDFLKAWEKLKSDSDFGSKTR